ncbi:MAG: ADP-ribosyltransferase domain-containing protein [Actinomycetota bacterium]|nr:ADP-ribosyltransferase domain-containing protein [Actinomycetota bacterium]MDA2950852.1 ADP-ribosyltransferase domain-containing protein [Actinomycetota bacterium]MDA2991272.1 ADP-ribosyltransferase domain-containing protein [Actinomycetota bacterium]
MCRSNSDGGRRCPGCGGFKAAAKANGNRRLGRLARKKVVDHLAEQGLSQSAKAILAAPPSLLPEFMTALGIDPGILGDTPMPSTHAKPPSAGLLIAQALAEREALAAPAEPELSPEQAAVAAAEQALEDAETKVDDARKAVNRKQAQRRKMQKEVLDSFPEPSQELIAQIAAATEAIEQAKADHEAAKQAVADAADDLVAARYQLAMTQPQEQADEYSATLTDADVDALARSVNRAAAPAALAALDQGALPALLETARDTSIYTPATFLMESGSGAVEVEGRLLDGGTAIHRRGSGDFLILQKRGDVYYGVAATNAGKAKAVQMANRIPMIAELAPLPEGAPDAEQEAYRIKCAALDKVAGQSAERHWTREQQQDCLDAELSAARAKIVDSVGAGPLRADIFDATKRHKALLRERAAQAAGEAARTAALAEGKTVEEAEHAYFAAHRRAMGTPTRGGGVIPHFEHRIPPDSIGEVKHKALWRSGIRVWGRETANDYAVIAQRAGNLTAWGFSSSGGVVKTSNIAELTKRNAAFVDKDLDHGQRSALRTYTGGSYQVINAAICGRDGVTPHGSIKTAVAGIESAFDTFKEKNPNMSPMTVMRGTRVPSGWKGSVGEYLDAAFTVGARVEIGKVTSCSTKQSTASAFAGHPPYMMVILTREGLPVKSISMHAGEDEVIVPTGSHLRCVHIDKAGVNGKPTVYLVGEDLVAEAEQVSTGSSSSWKQAS